MTTYTHTRDEEIKAIHIKYADFYRIGGGVAVIIMLAFIGGWIFGENQFALADNMLGYVTNVATEVLSVVAIVFVLDQFNRRRDKVGRKIGLFRQAKSYSNTFAIDAISHIRNEDLWDELLDHYHTTVSYSFGWEEEFVDLSQVQWAGSYLWRANLKCVHLTRADLQQANLQSANLQQANLGEANLQEALLWYANLQQANLVWANMEQVILKRADLQQANLVEANLQQSNLQYANLKRADLRAANLQQTDLKGTKLQATSLFLANLRNAENIETAIFDEKTVLPDAGLVKNESGHTYTKHGKFVYTPESYWTPDTDMTRYTNPEHPDFWEPNWVKRQREGHNED